MAYYKKYKKLKSNKVTFKKRSLSMNLPLYFSSGSEIDKKLSIQIHNNIHYHCNI